MVGPVFLATAGFATQVTPQNPRTLLLYLVLVLFQGLLGHFMELSHLVLLLNSNVLFSVMAFKDIHCEKASPVLILGVSYYRDHV